MILTFIDYVDGGYMWLFGLIRVQGKLLLRWTSYGRDKKNGYGRDREFLYRCEVTSPADFL